MDNSDVSHAGHRERLVDLAINAGVESLNQYQACELLLTYIFPRGDVNPLAHRLIDIYGTLTNIIDASVEDLSTVKGLNKRSAKKLSLFGELFFAYVTARMSKRTHIETEHDIVDMVEDLLRFRTSENIIMLGFSVANLLCGRKRISASDSEEVNVPIMDLTAFLSSVKPHSFVMAHCHPYGSARPSEADLKAFDMVQKICFDCGVNFAGCYIVGEDGVYSINKNKFARSYCDIDSLKKAFKC